MSIVNTDWASFLSPDSNLPPDVIFEVEGQSDDAEESIQRRNIGAHKLFLAGVSPVFWGMFFGPLKERSGIVYVKETSPEAFDTMVKYISQVAGAWSERKKMFHGGSFLKLADDDV